MAAQALVASGRTGIRVWTVVTSLGSDKTTSTSLKARTLSPLLLPPVFLTFEETDEYIS